MGNETVKVKAKTRERNGKKEKLLEYSFERERCRNCSHRAECIGKSTRIARLLRVSVNTPELYEYSQRAKTPEFLDEYRKRAKIKSNPKMLKLKKISWIGPSQRLRSKKCAHSGKINGPGGKL